MGSAAGKNVDNSGGGDGSGGSYKRRAYHAGSWYENGPSQLDATLLGYLNEAQKDREQTPNDNNNSLLRAVIVPHAGYRFSGPTAAYSYHALQQALSNPSSPIQHIVVLHPSHHVYLQNCAVSGATVLETPLGDLPVAEDLRQEILALNNRKTSKENLFTIMDASTDNEEHSGEMQYPYLAKLLLQSKQPRHKPQISVLPIMCGALSTSQEESFGQLLAPILARPEIVCVISSDFCHWGSRFRFTPTASDRSGGASTTTASMPIHEFISQMDHHGMDLIAALKPGAFADYLQQTRNTICGRHAIAVWLQAMTAPHHNDSNTSQAPSLSVNFVKYAQSSAIQSMDDSSVSYASAVVTAAPTSKP